MGHQTMEHIQFDKTGILLWAGSMLLNAAAYIDKQTVTFLLGTTVSILAIIHYVIQIRKNLKKNKDEKIS